eukprot:GHVN01068670.1.p1 GENE.GHVN01068670.1~~GHVN01068670.1.p1  ORF type:complete len:109 (-),score=1.31 GHVN01068670.1:206-508(-)
MPPNLCSQNEMRPDQPYGPMDRCPPWMPLPQPPQAAIANHSMPSHCVPNPSRDKASSIGFAVLAAGIVMSVARKDTSAAVVLWHSSCLKPPVNKGTKPQG